MKTLRPSLLSVAFWNNLLAFVLTCAAFSVFFQESPGGCGDYPQNFEVLQMGVAIGAALALVFYFLYPGIPNAFIVQPVLLTIIRYFLASIILSYGFAKVFASQFPHLMANMDARMTELTPMRVAWAFFGYSKGYQIFLGWGEVIPAVLLLFRRTTLLGSILMFTVMLNVFLVNIFFDVCVKLNSGIYMVLALYIMLQETSRLWSFFFTQQITGPRVHPVLAHPRWLKITGKVLNYLALAYILFTSATDAWSMYQYAHTPVTQAPMQGPWRAVSATVWKQDQWQPQFMQDSLYADRIFFEGQNGVIQSDFIRDRFRYVADSTAQMLTVTFTNNRNEWNTDPVQWKYEFVASDSLNLWIRWRSDSLLVKCVRRKEKLTRY